MPPPETTAFHSFGVAVRPWKLDSNGTARVGGGHRGVTEIVRSLESTVLGVVSIKLVAVSYATSANETTLVPAPSVSRATSTRCE